MISLNECLYYLVREDHNFKGKVEGRPDWLEDNNFFNTALEHVKTMLMDRIPLRLANVEILALINAAKRRGRIDELDKIFEPYRETQRLICLKCLATYFSAASYEDLINKKCEKCGETLKPLPESLKEQRK